MRGSLLVTVLGELVLPAGGSALTSTFIDVLGRVGMEEKAVRQALMRAARDGWLESERTGRRTLWTLTPSTAKFLSEGAERIYGFTASQSDWDGRWLQLLARAPESDRRARHILRTRLTWAGFGSPAPGVWLTTHLDRAAEASRVLDEAGARDDAQLFVASHYGGAGLAALVRQAWDLEAIGAEYEAFIAEFADPSPEDRLARLVQLVHAWRRFPLLDPALPRELLPGDWSGTRAAALFKARHATFSTSLCTLSVT
jgi:phenylacetic acid degradation operon negative regulatory protein